MTTRLESLEDISLLSESDDLECKLASGRDGSGQLPQDFWPTYSAFANTHGGLVVLGVRQTATGFICVGLTSPEKLKSDLFNQLNNPQKASANLLSASDAEITEIGGCKILLVRIPQASRKNRPVYVNGNPMTGTYRRSDEGDRKCDVETVRRMLAEQTEDSRDNRVLNGFTIDDLSRETVASYRQVMRDRTPAHPFLDADDANFLMSTGAMRRDRETGTEGLTVAGLLMFGSGESIRDEFPNFHLDYQERPRAQAEQRWVDRVTVDGTWSGNLFDFYRRIYRKLVADLKAPFALKDGQRQDETPVHQALREALVNAIVHADYTAPASVLIVKRPDMFGFRNPGRMRVPAYQAMIGGESDGRNRTLQKMFLLIGAGETAGSGVPKIRKGWTEQHWVPPLLYDLSSPSEQTRLELRMSDLIPAEALERLREQFGGKLDGLTADQRLVLATAAMEPVITHSRMLSICDLHPVDLSRMLQSLVQGGFLETSGRSRGTVYRLPGISLPSPEALFGAPQASFTGAAVKASDLASKPLESVVKPSEFDSTGLTASSEDFDPKLGLRVAGLECRVIDRLEDLDPELQSYLQQQAAEVRAAGKVAIEVIREVILNLCASRYITIKVLAVLLNRNETYLRQSVLNPMVLLGSLARAFPQAPNHPRQAYISASQADITMRTPE